MIKQFTFNLLFVATLCAPSRADEPATVSFRKEIAPILRDHCLACHGPKKAEGGYRVDTYEQILKPGDTGESPILLEGSHTGELVKRFLSEDEFERMPLESEPLTGEQIKLFEKWVQEGGKFDGKDVAQKLTLLIPPPTGAEPPIQYGRPIPITATCFSPSGDSLLTSGYHEILQWNLSEKKIDRRIRNVPQRVFAMSFSPDGKVLAIGGGEPGRSGEVRFIDFATGEVLGVVARAEDVVLGLAYRPGTNELAVAVADSTIRIVDCEAMSEKMAIASHADRVNAVSWSDDGKYLASASRDQSAKVYNGDSGELIASYLGHHHQVSGVAVLSEPEQVLSVGADQKLHRWNLSDAKKVAEIPLSVDAHGLTKLGDGLLLPCSDGRVLSIDLSTNQIAKDFKGHTDWALSVSHGSQPKDASVQYLASGAFDGKICVWTISDAELYGQWLAKP